MDGGRQYISLLVTHVPMFVSGPLAEMQPLDAHVSGQMAVPVQNQAIVKSLRNYSNVGFYTAVVHSIFPNMQQIQSVFQQLPDHPMFLWPCMFRRNGYDHR